MSLSCPFFDFHLVTHQNCKKNMIHTENWPVFQSQQLEKIFIDLNENERKCMNLLFNQKLNLSCYVEVVCIRVKLGKE